VALKVLAPELTRDEEAKQRFVREAQTVSGLQHHNICTIHDIDEDERGRLFAHWAFMRPLDAQPRAKAAATRALQLDPDLPEAHASMGWINTFYDWDCEAAEREFEQALTLNPSFAQAHEWYGLLLGTRGQLDRSAREVDRALALEPLSLVINAVMGLGFYWRRRHDEALAQFRRTLELDPNFGIAHLWQGFTGMAVSRWDIAIDSLTRLVALWQESPIGVGYLGAALAMAGRREEALAQVARLDALSQRRWVSPFYRAIQSMALGDTDAAFAHLDQACIEREGWMPSVATFPMFDPLRDDVGFAALLTRIGLR
jgi:tetratricopeptide (TPR) repeat protein